MTRKVTKPTKQDLFEILDHVPNTRNRGQLVALCFAYDADVESTLDLADEINRDADNNN